MSSNTKLVKTSRLVLTGDELPEIYNIPADPNFWVGPNRAPITARSLTKAQDDLSAIEAWLTEFEIKPTTHANYLKEARRLVYWAVHQKGVPISGLFHEDLKEYRDFLLNPFPPSKWVNRTKRPFGHPEWKPFTGPLSVDSAHQARVVINVMFSWLVKANYLRGNPLALMRKRKVKDKRGVVRYMDKDVIEHVLDSIDGLPAATEKERMEKARARWLAVILYQTAMRISEVSVNKMGQVRRILDKEKRAIWQFDVLGKGDKWGTVPISEQFLDECAAYRESIGLSGRPMPGDETPLLCSIRFEKGSTVRSPLSRQHIHKLLKRILKDAIKKAQDNGNDYAVAQLTKASAHWFRHSAASHMADDGVDLVKIRDAMRHEDISTTSRYLHTNLSKMHKEVTESLALPKKTPRE